MQNAQLQVPVTIPVFHRQSDGTYDLDSFVVGRVCITRLSGKLDQAMGNVICSVAAWTRTAMMERVPCALVIGVDGKTVTVQYYTSGREMRDLRTCCKNLKLDMEPARGDVAIVEGNVFVRSYANVVGYALDFSMREYVCNSMCFVPAKMHHCSQCIRDAYSFLRVIQTLREEQIKAATVSFTVVAVNSATGEVYKYKTHPAHNFMFSRHYSHKRSRVGDGSHVDRFDEPAEKRADFDLCQGPFDDVE